MPLAEEKVQLVEKSTKAARVMKRPKMPLRKEILRRVSMGEDTEKAKEGDPAGLPVYRYIRVPVNGKRTRDRGDVEITPKKSKRTSENKNERRESTKESKRT